MKNKGGNDVQALLKKQAILLAEKENWLAEKKVLVTKNNTLVTKNDTLVTKNNTLITEKETAVQKLEADLKKINEKYESLHQSFLDYQRHRFGQRSEQFSDDMMTPLPLFDTTVPPAVESKPDDVIEDIRYTRRKKNASSATFGIPTREEIISVDESDRVCGCCGREKTCIRYEKKQLLNYQTAEFEIIHQKRDLLACKKGCVSQIVTAPAPKHILPKSSATESLLAFISVSKVLDRQPLYNLEKRIKREYGWNIQRKTMARWMIQLADKLQPLINLMKDQILDYDISAIDATTLQVLVEENRLPQVKSQIY